MDRELIFVDREGRETSNDELNKAMSWICQTPKITLPPIKPPKDLREFEDRLGEVYLHFQEQFFGLKHEIGSGKTLKRDRGAAALVEALFDLERHEQQNGNVFHTIVEGYPFLKMVLESDAPLFEKDFYLLGLRRDRSGITKARQNEIALQCAAQVLWHVQGGRIPTIEAMTGELLKKDSSLYKLLELDRFNNRRTIQDWVRPIFPIPPGQRKEQSHRKKGKGDFGIVMKIPGIFTEDGVSFPRLRFALICLTRILQLFRWEKSQVISSPFVRRLADPLQWYPRLYVENWICEAYVGNGSIFTQ